MPIYQTTITVDLPVIVHYRISKCRPATPENPEEPAELVVETVALDDAAGRDGDVTWISSEYWDDQRSQLEELICEHLADSAADYPEPDNR